MEFSFPRYLLAKQTVDDRALNQHVFAALKVALPVAPLSIVEVGAGIGTMLPRLLEWQLFSQAEYTLVDEQPENIAFARAWLPQLAGERGYSVELLPGGDFRLTKTAGAAVLVHCVQADLFDFIRAAAQPPADLLIAHAVLDLLPMPASLPPLFSLLKPDGLAWLTINFDGVTSFEPVFDPALDAKIEQLYHASMDARPTGGDSQAGRHLFGHLEHVSARIRAAGASDWVVYPLQGQYPVDEAYFLHFILHFFETSLTGHPELDPQQFARWLAGRRAQIERGELVYIAHQMDFLVAPPPTAD